MDRNISEAGPVTDPNFWAIRNSLLPASREMEDAANLLSEAADMILSGCDEAAIALIHQADIPALFDVREQAVRSPPVFSVHRLRKVANLAPTIPKVQRDRPFASESALGETVFRRDGWRCRYCGCRTIPARARRWMHKRLPGAIRWSQSTNLGCHAGFWTLWASVDHVVPRALGGRNEAENLVTACMVCNFAREHYTLEQVGLANPRDRPPVLDGWDGLTRLLATAATPTPTALPRSGGSPAGDPVAARTESERTAKAPRLSAAEYYARFEVRHSDLGHALQVFLADLADLGVTAEFVRSIVLRFSTSAGQRVSAGSILTDGRVFCADAYFHAQKHDRRNVGEHYLLAIANLSGGVVRSAGREIPEVFGRGGKQINVADLLPNAGLWRSAVEEFVRDMLSAPFR